MSEEFKPIGEDEIRNWLVERGYGVSTADENGLCNWSAVRLLYDGKAVLYVTPKTLKTNGGAFVLWEVGLLCRSRFSAVHIKMTLDSNENVMGKIMLAELSFCGRLVNGVYE